MRTLFIFPVVYLIMWIPPFVNHLYQVITYDSNATTLPAGTYAVTVLATIFLPSQGFVNVCVYAVRERPWRRRRRRKSVVPPNRTAAFGEYVPSEKPSGTAGDIQAQIDLAKMNHNKMSDPVDAAYTRRDIERGERELSRVQAVDTKRVRHHWWEAQGR
jgi:hypothetical protein